jgi:hypothetical protein
MTEVQAQASVEEVRAVVALARGDNHEALELAQRAYRRGVVADATAPATAIRAAAWLGDAGSARETLAALDGQHGRVVEAARREAASVLAILEGRRDEGTTGFIDAIRRWRELGFEFEAAMCALSLVTLVGPGEPDTRAAGLYAGAVFERVGASLHHALLVRAMGAVPAATPTRRETPAVDSQPVPATRVD